MPNQLPIWDKQMLLFMEFCIDNNLKCTTLKEWCNIIKIGTTAIPQIKNGKASFRHIHILKACKVFSLNPSWVYGVSDKMLIKKETENPFTIIKSNLNRIEKMLQKK